MSTFKKYNQLGEEEEPWVGRPTRAIVIPVKSIGKKEQQ